MVVDSSNDKQHDLLFARTNLSKKNLLPKTIHCYKTIIFSFFILLFLVPLVSSSPGQVYYSNGFENYNYISWAGVNFPTNWNEESYYEDVFTQSVTSQHYTGSRSCEIPALYESGTYYSHYYITSANQSIVNPHLRFKAKITNSNSNSHFYPFISRYQTAHTTTFSDITNTSWASYDYNLSSDWFGGVGYNKKVGIKYSGSSGTSEKLYIDDFEIYDAAVSSTPSLPESNGTIYFQYDPYSVTSEMNVRYNECFDFNQTGYHWFGLLHPLYYYNEYPILKIDSGTYENSSYMAVDDILYHRLDPTGNCWDQYTKTLTANDYGVLRAQLLIKKDYYYGIKGLYMKYVSSVESVYDTDYAYHNNFVGNSSATAPVSTTTNDTVDQVPTVPEMLPSSDNDLPDGFDSDNDQIDDNDDNDTDNNNMNDSIDSDNDDLPDPVDPEDQNPDNDGSTTDTDIDEDGVSDPIDTDDDGDGDPDITDPDDDGDNIPDELDGNNIGPVPTPYNNSTYVPYLPGNTSNNSTYYGVLDGYYSSVDSVISPIDSGVSGFLNMAVYPLTGLSSAINSVTGSATGIFSGALGAILPAGLFIDAVFSALPEKINAFISYYLLLTIILLILGRSWSA